MATHQLLITDPPPPPPPPMKPLLSFKYYTMVRIEYTHTSPAVIGPPAVAAQDITRKRDVVFCPDTTDKERLLHVIEECLDACNDTLLHIHDADRYIHFRQVLGGSLKTTWDTIVTTHRNAFAHHMMPISTLICDTSPIAISLPTPLNCRRNTWRTLAQPNHMTLIVMKLMPALS